MLAPNARLRYQVIALGREQGRVKGSTSGQFDAQSGAGSCDGAPPGRRTSSRWAALIARIYEVLPLVCPSIGASMSIIAFITVPVPVRSILSYLDLPSWPPLLSPARAPPQTNFGFLSLIPYPLPLCSRSVTWTPYHPPALHISLVYGTPFDEPASSCNLFKGAISFRSSVVSHLVRWKV